MIVILDFKGIKPLSLQILQGNVVFLTEVSCGPVSLGKYQPGLWEAVLFYMPVHHKQLYAWETG